MSNYVLKDYQPTGFGRKLMEVEDYQDIPMLPLIHKADGLFVRDTVKFADDYFKSGMIEPVMCDVFNEEIIYTFVGRPAFNETMFPTCFVIEPAEELLENVFVFDTGAYASDRYEKLIDDHIDINEFRIPAESDYIKRLIASFFGSNIKYYISTNSDIKEMIKKDSFKHEALFDYIVLSCIRQFKALNFDTRCRTIENILRKPIDLKRYLKAIVISTEKARTQEFKNFIEGLGHPIDIIKYHTFDINAGSESNTVVKKLLYKYYVEKELM